jgi:hypothetical protein
MGLADEADAVIARMIAANVPVENAALRAEAERLRYEVVDHLRVLEDVLQEASGSLPADAGDRPGDPGAYDDESGAPADRRASGG